MSRPLLSFLVTAWLLAGSIPLFVPTGSEGAPAPAYGDESYGRFECVNPYPTGHALYDVAWSPDGSYALLAGSSGTILRYDGFVLTTVYTNTDVSFTSVAWYPSGEYALITGTGGKLLKYQDGTFKEIPTGTTVPLRAIDINPNTGLGLIVGEQRTMLKVDGEKVTTLSSGGNLPLRSVSWEPAGTYALAVGQQPGYIGGAVLRYWPENGTIRSMSFPSVEDFRGVAFSPNDEVAFISGRDVVYDNVIYYWNGSDANLAWTGSTVGGAFEGIDWSPDGLNAYVAENTGLMEFDSSGNATGREFSYYNPQGYYELLALDWKPDGSEATVVGYSGQVLRFDGAILVSLKTDPVGNTALNGAAWNPDGTQLIAVGNGRTVVLYDGTTLQRNSIYLKASAQNLYACAWKPDGTYALLVGDSGSIVKFTPDVGFETLQSGTVSTLRAVAWAPNGSYALIVGDGGTIRKFNGVISTPVPAVTGYTLRGVAFRPNDSMAFIVGGDVRSVQGATGRVSTSWQVVLQYNGRIVTPGRIIQQGPVFNSISFSPAIMAADNGELVLIEEYGPYKHYNLTVASNLLSAVWLQEGQDALFVGEGGTAALLNWSRRDTRELASGTFMPFTAIAMRPQGDYAICVGAGGMVQKYYPNAQPSAVVLANPSSVTDNSLELGWTPNNDRDFNRYEVYQSIPQDFAFAKTILATPDHGRTSLLVGGLSKLTTYHYKVRVYDNAGLYTDSNVVKATTLLGNVAPVASVLSAPSSITDSSMKLEWTRNNDGDFASYELHKSTIKDFVINSNTLVSEFLDRDATSSTITNLPQSTNYYFRLRTYDSGGLRNDSNEVNATTEAVNLPPAAVTLSPPTDADDRSMTLTWTKNNESDFDSYELYMSNETGFNISDELKAATISNQSAASYMVTGLAANSTYYFRMRVLDLAGLYNDSNEVGGTTTPPNAPPAAVTLSPVVAVTETTASLAWTRNSERDFKQYEVHAGTQPGFTITTNTAKVTLVDQEQTSYTVTDLASGTTYYFKIRVKDISSLYADSNEEMGVTEPNQHPEAVTMYGAVNVTDRSLELEWSVSGAADFARYELHRSLLVNYTPSPSTLLVQITDPQAVRYYVAGLDANTTYNFKVRVYDTGELYNDSNEMAETTAGPDLPPVAPVLADPEEITETAVLLEWTRNLDLDFARYVVHKSSSRGFPATSLTEVKSITDQALTQFNVTGLKPNTQYYLKVQVVDLGGQTNLSNEVRAKTFSVNVPPTADAGGDRTVTVNIAVQFSGFGYDTDGYVVSYEWDFQSDGDYDHNSPDGNTTYTYSDTGLYTARLRVTDDRGGTGEAVANITVEPPTPPNVLPVILDAGESAFAYIGEELFFAGNATDPDGYIVKYQWDFLGEGLYEYESPVSANTSFFYDTAGNYTAVLRVTDDRGGAITAERRVQIVRYNNPPVARIDTPRDKQKYYVDDLVTLSATSSYDPDGDRITYLWENRGDGRKLGNSVTTRLTLSKGDYLIRLTVSDGDMSGESLVNITVQERPNVRPTIKVESPGNNTIQKGIITISGSAKDDTKVSYVEIRIDPSGKWQKASGARSWSFELDTRPMALGKHTIYARSFDGIDYSDEANIVINVNNPTPQPAPKKSFIPGFEAWALGLAAVATLLTVLRRRK